MLAHERLVSVCGGYVLHVGQASLPLLDGILLLLSLADRVCLCNDLSNRRAEPALLVLRRIIFFQTASPVPCGPSSMLLGNRLRRNASSTPSLLVAKRGDIGFKW